MNKKIDKSQESANDPGFVLRRVDGTVYRTMDNKPTVRMYRILGYLSAFIATVVVLILIYADHIKPLLHTITTETGLSQLSSVSRFLFVLLCGVVGLGFGFLVGPKRHSIYNDTDSSDEQESKDTRNLPVAEVKQKQDSEEISVLKAELWRYRKYIDNPNLKLYLVALIPIIVVVSAVVITKMLGSYFPIFASIHQQFTEFQNTYSGTIFSSLIFLPFLTISLLDNYFRFMTWKISRKLNRLNALDKNKFLP